MSDFEDDSVLSFKHIGISHLHPPRQILSNVTGHVMRGNNTVLDNVQSVALDEFLGEIISGRIIRRLLLLWICNPSIIHDVTSIFYCQLCLSPSIFLLGGITAVMGASASGKSLLMQVLAGRVQDLSVTGEFLLEGIQADQSDIRNNVAYVPQDDILMGMKSNLSLNYFQSDALLQICSPAYIIFISPPSLSPPPFNPLSNG